MDTATHSFAVMTETATVANIVYAPRAGGSSDDAGLAKSTVTLLPKATGKVMLSN